MKVVQTVKLGHVRGMADISSALPAILETARNLKARKTRQDNKLRGKAILLIFEKNSTRTRVSFEVGITRLGGTPVIMDSATSQMGRGESIEDTAKVLSRYGDGIIYRAHKHSDLLALADHATVPVVNALTDLEHPCQILADWMTLEETWGSMKGRTFAYVGDGNNMCNTYLLAAPLAGMNIRVATPAEFAPNPEIVARAQELAARYGTHIAIGTDPVHAVSGADAVATDTWVSMGDEAQAAIRKQAFAGFTVDETMMTHAARDAVFLHCLPGHWGEEATYSLAHGPRSLIYDEAENRMWVQMALLVHLMA